jgi:ribose 1,5-bisphosphokinase
MTTSAEIFKGTSERIGPGHLVLVVGPSGAGKDTLITHARQQCPDSIGFPRRVVTRPPSAAEDHDSLSKEAFDRALAEGAFALSWQAHGLKYGIPASADADIRAGRTVVCNASRTVIAAAREQYAHVTVVLITAPPEVLATRLAQRSRATDGSPSARLSRNIGNDEVRPDAVIDNADAIEAGVERLLDVILRRFAPVTL